MYAVLVSRPWWSFYWQIVLADVFVFATFVHVLGRGRYGACLARRLRVVGRGGSLGYVPLGSVLTVVFVYRPVFVFVVCLWFCACLRALPMWCLSWPCCSCYWPWWSCWLCASGLVQVQSSCRCGLCIGRCGRFIGHGVRLGCASLGVCAYPYRCRCGFCVGRGVRVLGHCARFRYVPLGLAFVFLAVVIVLVMCFCVLFIALPV